MPGLLHEYLAFMFLRQPALLRRLCPPLGELIPNDAEAHEASASLSDIAPVAIHADQIIEVGDPATLRIILEVQTEWDPAKRGAWAAYLALSWRSSGMPTVLLAVTVSDEVERHASQPLVLGPGAMLQPLVIGPSAIPVTLDTSEIEAMPALGLLTALAHRRVATANAVRDHTLLTAARLPREERIPLLRLLAPTMSAALLRMEEETMLDEELDALMIRFMARTTDRIDEAEDRALEAGRAEGIAVGKAEGSRMTSLALAAEFLAAETVEQLRTIADPAALSEAVAAALRARIH